MEPRGNVPVPVSEPDAAAPSTCGSATDPTHRKLRSSVLLGNDDELIAWLQLH